MKATNRPLADIAGVKLLLFPGVPSVAALTTTGMTWAADGAAARRTNDAASEAIGRRVYMRRLSVGSDRGERDFSSPPVVR